MYKLIEDVVSKMKFPFEKIWIVIPAFNEETMIRTVVADLKQCGFNQILVVDDGSTDNTKIKASEAGGEVISHIINRGVGAATCTGFEAALNRAEWIITCDADGQHLAQDVLRVAQKLIEDGADLVIGSRFIDRSRMKKIPARRRIYNRIGNFFTQLTGGLPTTDSQSGLRGIRSEALRKLNLNSNGMEICSEIVYEAADKNLSWEEIAIEPVYTDYSLSKGQSFFKGIKTATALLLRKAF